jgi:ParB-like chromosome segregation protein Spo0J
MSSVCLTDVEPAVRRGEGGRLPSFAVSNRMATEFVPIETVKAARRELRKQGARKRALLEANLERFDQVLPILCDGELNVIDGHAVLGAAKRLGWTTIAIIRVTHLSEAELRVLRIGLNKRNGTSTL